VIDPLGDPGSSPSTGGAVRIAADTTLSYTASGVINPESLDQHLDAWRLEELTLEFTPIG